MMRWLVLRLSAPLVSFGGEAIDARGVTRDFPAASALTGLLGNALGHDRRDTAALDRLQARLVFGARREAEPPLGRMTDFQTAKLDLDDRGWTMRGSEGRAGGAATYDSPHIRPRDYHADAARWTDLGGVTVVLRIDPAEEAPGLDALAAALDRPERPLFIGRKSCLPAAPLNKGFVEAASAHAALMSLPARAGATLRAMWPAEEDGTADRVQDLADQRNWRSGLHGGSRRVAEGRIVPAPLP